MPVRAPRPRGSRFSPLLTRRQTVSQWTAECTEEDGWFWPCSLYWDCYKGWRGTSGVPSRTRPFTRWASPSPTSHSWCCGAPWGTPHGCCLCGWWIRKVSCSDLVHCVLSSRFGVCLVIFITKPLWGCCQLKLRHTHAFVVIIDGWITLKSGVGTGHPTLDNLIFVEGD